MKPLDLSKQVGIQIGIAADKWQQHIVIIFMFISYWSKSSLFFYERCELSDVQLRLKS